MFVVDGHSRRGTTPTVNRRRKKCAVSNRFTAADRRQLFIDCGAPRLFATTYYFSKNSSCSAVREANGNARRLWQTLSSLLKPTASTTEYFTAQQFSQVFKNKVDKIRSATAGAPSPAFAPRCESQLVSYRPVTTDEVRRLLSHVPNKQCSLDPVPTWLLKALTNTVPDIIARLINVSLQSAGHLSVVSTTCSCQASVEETTTGSN